MGERKEVSSALCTPEEIAYARAANTLRVDSNYLGWVDEEWLGKWRARQEATSDEPGLPRIRTLAATATPSEPT